MAQQNLINLVVHVFAIALGLTMLLWLLGYFTDWVVPSLWQLLHPRKAWWMAHTGRRIAEEYEAEQKHKQRVAYQSPSHSYVDVSHMVWFGQLEDHIVKEKGEAMIRNSRGNARKATVRCTQCGYESLRSRVRPDETLVMMSCHGCGRDIIVRRDLLIQIDSNQK